MKLEPAGANAALAAELGGQAKLRGLKAWVVGGCVRDWLMGRSAKDMDIVASARCEALAQYCRRKYGARFEAFGSFGTMRCFFPDGSRLDLSNARAEVYAKPAALPVVSPASIQRDLRRRDFTVNAIAASIMPDDLWNLKDPFHGIADIERGELKVLHAKSFVDDPTRMYRACRFAGRFGWKIQPAALAQMRRAVLKKLPALLSRARLRQELWRILEEKAPAPVFRL
ncbi:MAG: CCA tRNA nucleotidyltransferase, partial [Elusimicrobia bacterium]|nr:CCA tRNA nucleotidyltransferase [Elusimicrobiota bacterium]